MDLEYRLRAGDRCPLAGEYFGVGAGDGWTREEQAELIALEYQWRWRMATPRSAGNSMPAGFPISATC